VSRDGKTSAADRGESEERRRGKTPRPEHPMQEGREGRGNRGTLAVPLPAPSSGHCIPGAVIQRNRLDLRAAAMQLAFSRHSIKY